METLEASSSGSPLPPPLRAGMVDIDHFKR